eukprot:TRINITY_DN2171_c0_g1_i13.p1 TRINITY_DN2171_c0_g1~~TRINITY_DN2171_c0_g1_i13.p1  ORF type:complete len:113 (-),score=19.28 TRINITY_DN2171_c0_g1_i13:1465-1803(-)
MSKGKNRNQEHAVRIACTTKAYNFDSLKLQHVENQNAQSARERRIANYAAKDHIVDNKAEDEIEAHASLSSSIVNKVLLVIGLSNSTLVMLDDTFFIKNVTKKQHCMQNSTY